jgi:peptide/nickel transport system permease protein
VARFVARRLAHAILVILIVTFAITFLLDLSPGDPAYAILGESATPEMVKSIHEQLNLDEPIYTRYVDWVGQVAQGDFGTSQQTQEKVSDLIIKRFPVTFEVILLGLLMALAVSIPIGVYSAYRADGRFDHFWGGITSAVVSTPPFVSALLVVYVFALLLRDFPIHFPALGWVPISEGLLDNLWYAFLPSLTLALVVVPFFSRVLRADMIATLQSDFILTARAKGLPNRRILLRHALRPSLFSLVTLAALSIGSLIGAAIVVESLFNLPGLGSLLIQSVLNKDLVVVQGLVMFLALLYIVVNSLTDLAYGFLDPRTRSRHA